jgi:predicted AlkP superfamily phosphohydrolase/phosphomutase
MAEGTIAAEQQPAISCRNSRPSTILRLRTAASVLLRVMAKVKTLSEAETARRRAVTGLRNLGRDDDADRIDALSTTEYAAEKGFEIVGENANPHRRTTMPRKSKDDIIENLKDQVADLEAENEELQGQLEEISDVISGTDADEGDEEDDSEDEDLN